MSDARRDPHKTEDSMLSTLLAESPELWSLVERFVRELPGRVESLQDAVRAGSFEQVKALAHDLGETGADYGYQALHDKALQIEQAAGDAVVEQLEAKVAEMRELLEKIRAGLQTPEA